MQEINKQKTSHSNAVHPAFDYINTRVISALNCSVEHYRHKVTGADHYHLAANNKENVFLVALRTVPTDSTGVAHILEHTALCGSKRYPVRDPFFMMIRRSLNTFMNAFTSSDWTAYPFASQNRKDFDNLLDVYLDAVFFSNLDEMDFLQEGHRIEFASPNDPTSDLVYKGVVFNEMKGAMASPVSLLWQTLTHYLFPTTTYHYNSGGDPQEIPSLSYAQLKDFYQIHYHPSNSVFLTYGDISAAEHHSKFEDLVLSKFSKSEKPISVANEKRLLAPVAIEEYYALDDAEQTGDKTHIVLAWLLGASTDLETQLSMHLLSGVLLDNSSSPLRKALETTELGSAPSPLCGLEDSNKEMTFMCGIEGAKPENAPLLQQLVFDVLTDVANNGVPQEHIESILHQLELEQREVGGGHYPYGLQLILDALSSAVHDGDVAAALDIDPILVKLRNDIQNPDFIKNLIQQNLLENYHLVRLTMRPDAQLSKRRQLAEAKKLAAIKLALTPDKSAKIVEMSQRLAERQTREDDAGILPKVGIEDVPDVLNIADGLTITSKSKKINYFPQPTNGLCYQQIVTQIPQLPDDLLEVLPYFSNTLTEVGCGNQDYLQMQALQASVSGGVNAFSSIRGKVDNVNEVSGHYFLSSKALSRNHRDLTKLLRTTLEDARFDEKDRIRELIAQIRAQREQSVMGSGHNLAMLAASSGFSQSAYLQHQSSGLQGVRFIKRLDDSLENTQDIDALCLRFNTLAEILRQSPRQFMLVSEIDNQDAVINDLDMIWADTHSTAKITPFNLAASLQPSNQLWITNSPVNFCAKAYPVVPVKHADSAALAVLSGFLKNGFLHRAIREQGGAYGGGASYQSDIAVFRFYSYRDPRYVETLADFDASIDWLYSSKHEPSKLEEAILGVISGIDKPTSPAGEAKDSFHNSLFGRTPEIRRDYRSRILNVTIDDLQRVASTYLVADKACTAVISNSSTLTEKGDLGFDVITL